jgi:hypothetical protein
VRGVRAMFIAYLLVLLLGVGYAIAWGVAQR